MRIVGPARLRTIHTTKSDCKIKTDMNSCFHESMLEDYHLEKKDINGIKYQTCEQIGIDHSIQGEHQLFPCSGYVLDIYPNVTNATVFQNIIESKKKMLFGEGARGLNIEMTIYLPRYDWWVYAQVLYEYGIQGE